MTGGPRAYLPGLSCVVHQLHALRSAHPVVVVVPEEDAALLAPVVARHPNARLIVWNHFPHSFGGKWGHTNVLDKMNVLGAPFGRVVWLDADTFVAQLHGAVLGRVDDDGQGGGLREAERQADIRAVAVGARGDARAFLRRV